MWCQRFLNTIRENMKINVKTICSDYDFFVEGVSYIGNPLPNTAMYVTKKVEKLIDNISDLKECLIFVENTIDVPAEYSRNNCFVMSENPQSEYAKFVNRLSTEMEKEEAARSYTLTQQGYYIGEDVKIGKDPYIEPHVLIGHDVVIGNNVRILSGAIIKNTTIGNNVLINENAVIGANGFTMSDNEEGDKVRIPTMGSVKIGNNVEIGALDNVSRGSAGCTIIEDNVKLDAMVHIAHDVHIQKNVEIAAGVTIGGFNNIGERTFIGLNATTRNRIDIGDNCFVGMGAIVNKRVKNDGIVVGKTSKHIDGPMSRFGLQ